MGETRALIPLIPYLSELGEIVISCTTATGLAEAKKSIPQATCYFYLPIDFSFVMRRLVAHLQPDLFLLCESDFWYQCLKALKRHGAKIVLINGKISERSTARFQKVPYLTRPLFSLFDRLCVQNALYLERFVSLGVPKDKLSVTGNLKFDIAPPVLSDEEKTHWRSVFQIAPSDRVVVIGSTHFPEEKELLTALQPVWQEIPNLKVILVPRHPERFNEVEELLARNERVFLVKAMGILNVCYQLAEVAIVAGSFTPTVGGHNIFEPVVFHVPVLFGPFMSTQPELTKMVLQAKAGCQVTLEQLPAQLLLLLQNLQAYERMAQAGQILAEQVRGSAERTYTEVRALCLTR